VYRLIYQTKLKECVAFGDVSSRILELSEQNKNKRKQLFRIKQGCRMGRQTQRINSQNDIGKPNPRTKGKPGLIQEQSGKRRTIKTHSGFMSTSEAEKYRGDAELVNQVGKDLAFDG